jgi:hypothetical protein
MNEASLLRCSSAQTSSDCLSPVTCVVLCRQLCRLAFVLTRLQHSTANVKPLWQVCKSSKAGHICIDDNC